MSVLKCTEDMIDEMLILENHLQAVEVYLNELNKLTVS